jgi:cytidyltransferase-like protein
MINKIINDNFLLSNVKKKIILCHGVFDVFHIGHLNHFKYLKDKFTNHIIIVSITADKYVRKGIGRPLYNEKIRAKVLSSIDIVDHVYICKDFTAIKSIKFFKPDIYAKGLEYHNLNNDITKNIKLEKIETVKNGGKIIFTDGITSSSSLLINNFLKPLPPELKNKVKELKKKFPIKKILEINEKIKKSKILVIGEIIIDSYTQVFPKGKTMKENMVNHLLGTKKNYVGGVVPTANLLSNVSDNVTLLSLVSKNESENKSIKAKLNKKIIKVLYSNKSYITIEKNRFIEKNYGMKKLFQVSKINENFYSLNTERKIINYLNKNLKLFDLVVVSDFGHGLITKKIINLLEQKAKYLCVNCQSNSLNFGYNLITKYNKANFVCIDENEARLAANEKKLDLELVHKKISKKNIKNVIITLGSKGAFYVKRNNYEIFPVIDDKVIDTIGAGDAFFSTASIFSKYINDNTFLSFVGNVAGAIKIRIEGHNEYIKMDDILKTIETYYK